MLVRLPEIIYLFTYSTMIQNRLINMSTISKVSALAIFLPVELFIIYIFDYKMRKQVNIFIVSSIGKLFCKIELT